MEFLAGLKQSWGYIVAIAGGVTLLGTVSKAFKSMKTAISEPFTKVDKSISELKTQFKEDTAGLREYFTEQLKEHSKSDVKQFEDIGNFIGVAKDSLLTMQRQSIMKRCEELLNKGYADMNQKSALFDQYINYHDLGGDSFITELVNQVKELPLTKEE